MIIWIWRILNIFYTKDKEFPLLNTNICKETFSSYICTTFATKIMFQLSVYKIHKKNLKRRFLEEMILGKQTKWEALNHNFHFWYCEIWNIFNMEAGFLQFCLTYLYFSVEKFNLCNYMIAKGKFFSKKTLIYIQTKVMQFSRNSVIETFVQFCAYL